jgi:hypothetical protein
MAALCLPSYKHMAPPERVGVTPASQTARPVEDDAAAWPVFVFVRSHDSAQGGIDRFVAAPVISARATRFECPLSNDAYSSAPFLSLVCSKDTNK